MRFGHGIRAEFLPSVRGNRNNITSLRPERGFFMSPSRLRYGKSPSSLNPSITDEIHWSHRGEYPERSAASGSPRPSGRSRIARRPTPGTVPHVLPGASRSSMMLTQSIRPSRTETLNHLFAEGGLSRPEYPDAEEKQFYLCKTVENHVLVSDPLQRKAEKAGGEAGIAPYPSLYNRLRTVLSRLGDTGTLLPGRRFADRSHLPGRPRYVGRFATFTFPAGVADREDGPGAWQSRGRAPRVPR